MLNLRKDIAVLWQVWQQLAKYIQGIFINNIFFILKFSTSTK
jgi:hypothetical protein